MIYYGKQLSKEEVLVNLQNFAVAKSGKIIQTLTIKEAKKLLKNQTYFYEIGGKVLDIDLSNDEYFDNTGYDALNGANSAFNCVHNAIACLKREKGIKYSTQKYKGKELTDKISKLNDNYINDRKRFQEFFNDIER